MKYQEYLQITQLNKGYTKDFLSVLEDEDNPEPTDNPVQQFPTVPELSPQTPNSLGKSIELSKNGVMVPWMSTGDLQKKAK